MQLPVCTTHRVERPQRAPTLTVFTLTSCGCAMSDAGGALVQDDKCDVCDECDE
jgi:hypothetical protein